MEIKGQVTYISPITRVGKKQLEKQEIVVQETQHSEDYKNNGLAISFFGDKLDMTKELVEGDNVTVHYNTKAVVVEKEDSKRVFNNVSGRKLEIESTGTENDAKWGEDTGDTSLPF